VLVDAPVTTLAKSVAAPAPGDVFTESDPMLRRQFSKEDVEAYKAARAWSAVMYLVPVVCNAIVLIIALTS
jgi:hypothetical protein